MPNYQFMCETCQIEYTESYSWKDRPDHVICDMCGEKAPYKIGSPLVLKASYLDGNGRFSDVKEASKVLKEVRNTRDPKQRSAAEKEYKKIGVKLDK